MTTPTPLDLQGSLREDSRWSTWWSSWRVATRMARRDVRRHRGRSTLIVVMVFLPVVAVILGVVLIATQQVSATESLPYALGQGTAVLTVDDQGYAVDQFPTSPPAPACAPGSSCTGAQEPTRATTIPGWTEGHEAASLADLAGGTVLRVTASGARLDVDGRRVSASVLGIDAAGHAFVRGRATLESGRWPASPDEVAVTPAGRSQGLPAAGTIRLPATDGAPERTLAVVGVATGYVAGPGAFVAPADLVALPDAVGSTDAAASTSSGIAGVGYLLDRATPLTVADVRRLNGYSVTVQSAQTRRADEGTSDGSHTGAFAAYTGLAAVGLLVLTSLLAGPAFSVSASRQRRALAIVASNGATTAQVRRTVLAQALVLGVLAALVGGVVGVVGSWLVLRDLASRQPTSWWGPFDVPPMPVSIVVGSAVVSALVAALLPARGLGRLDIVRVMRGQEVSPRLHRGLPVVGVALLAGGTAVLAWGFVESADTSTPLPTVLISGGILLLVVGALCVIPAALALLGRLTRHLPVTVRMATRDASRQRGRATPTVAAVMAGAAVLTTLLVVVASTTRHDELTYTASIPPGTAVLYPDYSLLQDDPTGASAAGPLTAAARVAAPQLQLGTTWQVGSPDLYGSGGTPLPVVAALRTGCTTTALVSTFAGLGKAAAGCLSLSTLNGARHSSMVVGDAAYLARALDLSSVERAALARGAVLVVDGVGAPSTTVDAGNGDGSTVTTPGEATVDVVGGTVTLVRLTVSLDRQSGEPRVVGTPTTERVPAVPVARDRFALVAGAGAVMTTETARARHLPLSYFQTVAIDPAGPITAQTQDRLQATLDRAVPGSTVYVERGWTGDASLRIVTAIAIGVVAFLTLVATLIATALSQAEGQAFLGTLAAVGATRGTRRRIAGAQAGFLALAGVLLGVLVGLVPGVLMARATTGPRPYDEVRHAATVVVPWLELLAPVVAVPLVAAALAFVSIRATPTVTRRLT